MAKVLLIEDDSETAEEITAELADRGFEVEWSANGIDGLEKARSSRPDAMIVDRLLRRLSDKTVRDRGTGRPDRGVAAPAGGIA
jgi:two-component system OmpR family response regulator